MGYRGLCRGAGGAGTPSESFWPPLVILAGEVLGAHSHQHHQLSLINHIVHSQFHMLMKPTSAAFFILLQLLVQALQAGAHRSTHYRKSKSFHVEWEEAGGSSQSCFFLILTAQAESNAEKNICIYFLLVGSCGRGSCIPESCLLSLGSRGCRVQTVGMVFPSCCSPKICAFKRA